MIKHIVLIHWKEGTTEEQIAAVSTALAKLPPLIPEIKSYNYGADLKLYPGNADYAVIAEFESEEDFQVYSVHADHIEMMKEVTMPIMQSYVTSQFIE